MPKRKKERHFCNNCRNETNHTCIGEHRHILAEKLDDYDSEVVEKSLLWICDGCEKGTLEIIQIEEFPEEAIELNYEQGFYEQGFYYQAYYPPRTKLHVEAKHFIQLPKKLRNLYQEILLVFNNEASVLCAVGIRALIEGICADKEIPGKNLESRIDGLTILLPKNIIEGLHGIRFIGNVAAHELTAPKIDELRLAIEICEDLLNFLYELDYKTRRIAPSQGTKKLFSKKHSK